MSVSPRFSPRYPLVWLLALAGLVTVQVQAQTEPTIISTVPPMGATGISPSAPVVITFSEAMNPGMTTAQFIDMTSYAFLPTLASWNAGYTRMTNTPVQPFPANKMIFWNVDGESLLGDPLGGTMTGGYFT
ncbi:MAG TPA: Ig-like domain-containing protein, partial [Bacillota bacterium]|nr:Ig-like domain-containing protein [Bacillota bacterium]